jgi:hypothetical protein
MNIGTNVVLPSSELQHLTWGASFLRARQVVVRPALAYGAAVWHFPSKDPNKGAQEVAMKLVGIQNK